MAMSPGRYLAKIKATRLGSSSNHNLMIVFTATIAGKYTPGGEVSPEGAGTERTVMRTVTENTANRIWAELDLLGYTHDGFEPLAADGPQELAGVEVPLTCTHETYQGRVVERWEFALLAGQVFVPQADTSAVAAASRQFGRGSKAATTPPAGTGTGTRAAGRQPQASGEQIAF